VRLYPALSSFAALLIAIAPVHALAQQPLEESVSVRDRPREEYDPLGKRFGGFTLNASVALAAGTTDNLFATETGEESDTILSLSPSARLASNWSRHALVLEAGGRLESHQDFSNEDVDTGYGRATGRLDIGTSSSLSASVGASHSVEPRTNPDAPTGGDPVEFDRTDLSLSAAHRFNRVQVRATAARREYDYSGSQAFRDSVQDSLTGRVEAEVSPRVGLVFQAAADQREYDTLPALDSDGTTFLAGVSIDFTDLMRGEITAGQFNRDYASGGSLDGVAVEADLEWYVTGLTTISLHARRNAEEVGGTVAQPFTESQYGVRVDHELLRNVILTAGAEFGQREYDVLDRNDDFVAADVGADYFLNRRVALQARYRHDEVDSSGAGRYRDFEANAFTLGVSFRL
jgi:hypothetical protein